MKGIVQSGTDRKTLKPATVTLMQVSGGQSQEIAQTTTGEDGTFSIEPTAASKEPGFFKYLTVSYGDGVVLAAIVGFGNPERVVVNELTTVAAAYSAAQFLEGGNLRGDSLELQIIAAMNANLVDVEIGSASYVMTHSPNADETNSCRSLMSLANFLTSAVRDGGKTLEAFFALTNQNPPTNTVVALAYLARNPATHVGGIYLQSKVVAAYGPALERQPDAWTLVVKVNDSGDDTRMFGGPGSVAFDSQGRAWIPNNVLQGTGNSATYSIVLDLSGRPARDSNGSLLSPFSGGGLLGAGFGVAVDVEDKVWIGDFGWGKCDNCMPEGSVSLFGPDARPISPAPNGFTQGGMYRVQGTVVDPSGNVWLAGWGNGTVVCYRRGNPNDFAVYQDASGTFKPFGIAIATDGSAWVTNADGSNSDIRNIVLGSGQTMQCVRKTTIGNVLKGIQIDSAGNIWTGSGNDHHVYVFDSTGKVIGGYQGGGMWGPWGVTLDGDDNLWVGDFGPLEVGNVFHGRLTQLAGINATGYLLGDALTPPSGYTLPSAGSPVLLHDGTPLYGAGGPDCFIPMMRTTGVGIDAAGNVWTCNNWKPNFDNDLFGDPFTQQQPNPGGDGILIWVGLAKPPTRR